MGTAKIVLTHLPVDLSARSGLGKRFLLNIQGHPHYNPADFPSNIGLGPV